MKPNPRTKLIEARKKFYADKEATQKEISLLLGTSRKQYNRIERGWIIPAYPLACKIKALFGVDDSIFFDNNVSEMTHKPSA